MQVKLLKNSIVEGTHHWANEVIHVTEETFAKLKERGHIHEEQVAQNQPAHQEEIKTQEEIKSEIKTEEANTQQPAAQNESSEVTHTEEKPSDAPKE